MHFRLYWAVFLAIVITIGFYKSWNLEHDIQFTLFKSHKKSGSSKESKNVSSKKSFNNKSMISLVWTTPLCFPFTLGLLLILNIGNDGPVNGSKIFWNEYLDILIIMSIYYIILLLFLPLLRRRISSRACATLWLIPGFLAAYFPLTMDGNRYPVATIYVPEKLLTILFYLWIAGFALLLSAQIISHLLFHYKLIKSSEKITDPIFWDILKIQKNELRYDTLIYLYYCPLLSSPLSMGMVAQWSQSIFLPRMDYTEEELSLIFSHEIHHLQRRDVHTKFFLGFCRALCWFNPLIWFMSRKASDDLELSCDEIVLKQANPETRDRYAKLILHSTGCERGFSTCLSANAKSLRYRLKNIIHPRKKSKGVFIIAAALFFSFLSYGYLAVSSARGTVKEVILNEFSNDTNTSVIQSFHLTTKDEIYCYSEIPDPFLCEGDDHYIHVHNCSNKVLQYISGLSVEKIQSYNHWYIVDEPSFECTIESNNKNYTLSYNDKIMEVNDEDTGVTSYYLVKSESGIKNLESLLN